MRVKRREFSSEIRKSGFSWKEVVKWVRVLKKQKKKYRKGLGKKREKVWRVLEFGGKLERWKVLELRGMLELRGVLELGSG